MDFTKGPWVYAHVCSRMLTYAHVCSRMLTDAVYCSNLASNAVHGAMSGYTGFRWSLYLLYSYKSTHTDTWGAAASVKAVSTQFTCFTCTKVRILTPEEVQEYKYWPAKLLLQCRPWQHAQFTCFTSTRVHILTPEELLLQCRACQQPLCLHSDWWNVRP